VTDEEPLVSREPTVPDGDDAAAGHPLVTRAPSEEAVPDEASRPAAEADGAEPAAAAEEAPEAPVASHKGYLTARQTFIIVALVLLIALVVLVIWLLLMLNRPGSLVVRGGETKAGIEPVLTILGPGKGAAPRFKRPMGAAFGAGGRIYVADTGNNRVCVFDGNGGFLFEFGGFGVRKPLPGGKFSWAPGKLDYPIGIAVDPADDDVYVADFRNDQIQRFDKDGKYIMSFPDATKPVGRGSSGQDGTGIAVTDVAVSGGRVYATDTYQVFVFTTDGHLIRQFGKPGTGPTDLDHPNGIAVSASGMIYVSDSNHARIIAFDGTGQRMWTFGEVGAQSAGATESLGMPRGLAVMRDGSLIVTDAFLFNLTLIDYTGTSAQRFGERGTDPAQFNFANDVDVFGDLLVVADKESNRVEVVRLARR